MVYKFLFMKPIYYLFLCKYLWIPNHLFYCSKSSVVLLLCLKVDSVITQRLQLVNERKEIGLTLNRCGDYLDMCAPFIPFNQASQSFSLGCFICTAASAPSAPHSAGTPQPRPGLLLLMTLLVLSKLTSGYHIIMSLNFLLPTH